jgi:hypothetical protein
MATSQQLQEAPSAPNMESSHGSQHRSSVASMEHPAGGDRTEMVAENQQHYPVDDITVRTSCELLYQQRKMVKLVAHGIAEVPDQGGTRALNPNPQGLE